MTTTGPTKTTGPTRKPRQTSTTPRTAPVAEKPVEIVSEVSTNILVHFVSDGFTAFRYVWSTGQELEIEVPSPEYDATCNADGKSWLTLTEDEQVTRWGSVKFKPGPSDIPNSLINYLVLPGDRVDLQGRDIYKNSYRSRTEREKVAQAEKARGRNVPKV